MNGILFTGGPGVNISHNDENRLRFAVPTVKLTYGCRSSISERKYKQLKWILLNWPLYRALIRTPFVTMKKIYHTDACSGFMEIMMIIN